MLSRHPSGTQITHTDTSSANAKKTAATQITHTDTSSANANITAATQITHTDTSSANIIAATQITHADTSSANTNITAATQITHTDTSSANANITAAPQIAHTDTPSAKAHITAAAQITLTDISFANINISAATKSQLDTLSGPPQTHSPLWRALRQAHKRLPPSHKWLRTVQRLRTQTQLSANTASPPHPQSETHNTPKWRGPFRNHTKHLHNSSKVLVSYSYSKPYKTPTVSYKLHTRHQKSLINTIRNTSQSGGYF